MNRPARERPLGTSQHCVRQGRGDSAGGLGRAQLFAHGDKEERKLILHWWYANQGRLYGEQCGGSSKT